MSHTVLIRSVGATLLLALLTGCAVARWHVTADPLHGQSVDRQTSDARGCDTESQMATGYDRRADAMTWLWGVTAVPAFLVARQTLALVNLATLGALDPEIRKGEAAAGAAVNAVMPAGNPSWDEYFERYRACMSARGYSARWRAPLPINA